MACEVPKVPGLPAWHSRSTSTTSTDTFNGRRGPGRRFFPSSKMGFWGGRIYRVADLEGHHWDFSQRGRDLDARQWRLPPGVTMGLQE